MSRKTTTGKVHCALCGAKDVTEPKGEERYCADCWDKKIAVEEIVAREFVLKRYIRAHSAEKYLVYHSTQKSPCGSALVHMAKRRPPSSTFAAAIPRARGRPRSSSFVSSIDARASG